MIQESFSLSKANGIFYGFFFFQISIFKFEAKKFNEKMFVRSKIIDIVLKINMKSTV